MMPGGAGTARPAGEIEGPVAPAAKAPAARASSAGVETEIRWVGAQHLMHGYCGRAVLAGNAEVASAGVGAGGARAYAVRPMALLASRRHLVVRIGPRRVAGAGQDGERPAAPARAA